MEKRKKKRQCVAEARGPGALLPLRLCAIAHFRIRPHRTTPMGASNDMMLSARARVHSDHRVDLDEISIEKEPLIGPLASSADAKKSPIQAEEEITISVGKDLESAVAAEDNGKTSYVAPSTVVFWLSMWFIQNIGVTFWNKKALNAIRLPVTVSSWRRVVGFTDGA